VNPLILVALVGLSSVFIPTPVLTLVPRYLPSRYSGLGYGLSSTLANVGALIGPYFVGLIYDHFRDHGRGFDLMAFFAMLGAVIALLVPIAVKKSESRKSHQS
jgi:MFS family permease